MKKILSLFLALTMVMSLCAITVSADATAIRADSDILWSYNSTTKTLTFSVKDAVSGTLPNSVLYKYVSSNGELPGDGTLTGGGTVTNGGDYENTYYNGLTTDVRSPEKIVVQQGITTISTNALRGIKTLKTVELPQGLTTIGERIFENCKNLQGTITIPKSVTSIGTGLLHQSSEVSKNNESTCTSVVFESGSAYKITNNQLFKNAPALRKIYLPSGVTLDDNVTTLEDIFGEKHSVAWLQMDLSKITIETEDAALKTKLESLGAGSWETKPTVKIHEDGVTSGTLSGLTNGKWTFTNSTGVLKIEGSGEMADTTSKLTFTDVDVTKVTKIEFSNGITKIGASNFLDYTALTEIVFPNDLVTISNNSFRNDKISKISYKDASSNEKIGFPETLKKIGDNNFYQSTFKDSLDENGVFTIPASVEEIGSTVFVNVGKNAYDSGMRMIKFGEGSKLKKIGKNTFDNSYKIIVELPASIEEMTGEHSYLANGTYFVTTSKEVRDMICGNSAGVKDTPDFFSNGGAAVLVDSAIKDFGAITSDLTDGKWLVTDTELHIFGTGKYETSYANGTSYEWQDYLANIQKLVLHNGIKSLPNSFGGDQQIRKNTFSALKTLVLSNDFESFDGYTFANCIQEESVQNGSYIETIKHLDANQKEEVAGFPSTLKKIGQQAFQNNYYLCGTHGNTLLIPASVTEIADSAFIYAFHKQEDTSRKVTNIIFENGSKCTSIGTSAFYTSTLTTVEIPASVTTIKDNAFRSGAVYVTTNVYFEGNLPASVGANVFKRDSTEKTTAVQVYCYNDAITKDAFGDTQITKTVNGQEKTWDYLTVTKLDNKLAVDVALDTTGDNATATVTYRAPELMSGIQNYVLILAEYKDGVLQNADISKKGTITADMTNFETPITVSMTKRDGYEYKAFLWDSLTDCVPVK